MQLIKLNYLLNNGGGHMKMKKVLDSFNNAINGIIDTVRTERNMKIHLIVSLFILAACFFFDVTKYEFLILAVTISMVISAEIVNTAIEAAIDMTTNWYKYIVKVTCFNMEDI